jgi:hypothetical protein
VLLIRVKEQGSEGRSHQEAEPSRQEEDDAAEKAEETEGYKFYHIDSFYRH